MSTRTIAPPSTPPRQRVELMGVSFDPVTEIGATRHVIDRLSTHRGGSILTPNLDVMRQCSGDAELRSLVNSADLVVADGTPLVWASRVAGSRLPERVAGSSLVFSLSEQAALNGESVFFLGGNAGAAEAAAAHLSGEYPDLEVAGCFYPPHGFESDPEQVRLLVDALTAAQPSIVFVGLPFRMATNVIRPLAVALPTSWFLGCGISLSFVCGEVTRAPGWVQRSGFEWLHRLVQEPRRLGRRYLLQGPPALVRLMASALASRTRPKSLPAPSATAPGPAD